MVEHQSEGGTHQILGVQRNLVPPRRHELVVTVQDPAVHVLVPPRVKKGLEATESGGQRTRRQEDRRMEDRKTLRLMT